jgi:hypothetical protein
MKNFLFLAAFMVMLGFVSCTKDAAEAASTTTTAAATDIDIVAELRGGDGSGGNHGGKVHKGTPVNLTDVPQAAKDYATTNYAAYTVASAGKRDSAGVITYHLFLVPKDAAVTTTGTVALIFDANWKFVKVATPRQHAEGSVAGGHGNKGKDGSTGKHGVKGVVTSIDLTTVPQAAKTIVAAQAAGYTIEGAVKEDRSGVITYIIRATKTGVHPALLVFDANWAFVKRIH